MTAVLTYRGVVYPWQCDHNGHMNVMHYVGKFDEATWVFFELVGLTPTYLRESARGMVAVEQMLSYRSELVAGDTLTIRSQFCELSEKWLRFEHTMIKSSTGEMAASTVLKGVHIDAQRRKSCPIPANLRTSMQLRLRAPT
jgi:acyl-CoA thioester hydrolase